ncbi:sensor domain-containing protein [Jeotgalibacillus aurantiacus]|uniref:sensor domain-containing protein n=1 Tax=Jeotgalibacillus aurantiacus TaxID=2763266 RepID=UPI001D0AA2FE|nr:GGDEF domain-containing protein [Jeotgalibacillus aurantiacus]
MEKLLFRAVMKGIKEMVFIVKAEPDGEFTYAFLNEEAKMRSGLSDEDLGKPIQCIQPDLSSFLYSQYRKAAETKEDVVYKDSYTALSGETYYSKTRLSPLMDEKGECTHITALVNDITESTWAELDAEESRERALESRERFRSLFDHNLDAIFYLNLDGITISGNRAAGAYIGWESEPEEIHFREWFKEKDLTEVHHAFLKAKTGEASSFRTKVYMNGKKIDGLSIFVPVMIHHEVTGIYWILKDISTEMDAIKRFRDSEKKLRIIAENAQDLITLVDHKGTIIYASPSYRQVLGYHEREYEGQLFSHRVEEEYLPELEASFIESIQQGTPWKLQLRQQHHDKEWMWTELHGTPVFDDQDQFNYMVVVSRDITFNKKQESRLEYFAYHDSLTGLPNRRLLQKTMEEEQQSGRQPFSVLMLDIDHFKTINDELGHDAGDAVIEEFGRRLKMSTRSSDLVARLGGDEFIVLLRGVENEDKLSKVADKMLSAIRDPFHFNGMEMSVTTSIGMTVVENTSCSPAEILKAADKALYQAKARGRNTFSILSLN